MTETLEKPHTTTDALAQCYANLINHIGEDSHREGLRKTPQRAAIAFEYLTSGYQQQLDTIVNDAIFTAHADEVIVIKDIELYSLCEHHLLPFIGKCHIGYVPRGKILGLSKFARIVDMFARRLQTQEHLSGQIADAVEAVIDAKGVAVIIEADHLCIKMRGVEKQNSIVKTSVMKGLFRDNPRTRNELLQLLKI